MYSARTGFELRPEDGCNHYGILWHLSTKIQSSTLKLPPSSIEHTIILPHLPNSRLRWVKIDSWPNPCTHCHHEFYLYRYESQLKRSPRIRPRWLARFGRLLSVCTNCICYNTHKSTVIYIFEQFQGDNLTICLGRLRTTYLTSQAIYDQDSKEVLQGRNSQALPLKKSALYWTYQSYLTFWSISPRRLKSYRVQPSPFPYKRSLTQSSKLASFFPPYSSIRSICLLQGTIWA